MVEELDILGNLAMDLIWMVLGADAEMIIHKYSHINILHYLLLFYDFFHVLISWDANKLD